MTISELHELFLHHRNITTDSRNCPKGSLFFALRGDKFDGNRYAADALKTGAEYAVIDNPAYEVPGRTVLVDNVLDTLQQLARQHRKSLSIPVIGITGTNGKTTTKELIAAVLSTKYNTLYTEGNLNNQIGVPLTLLKLNHEHEMAVIEMGASHPGDIAELVRIACPNFGIITNVGKAHLEGFGSFENIIKTKGELYDYIRKVNGKIFIRNGNRHLCPIAQGIEQITYGDEGAFTSGKAVPSSSPFLTLEWKQQGKVHLVQTHLIGDYNLENVLAAIAIGRYFRIPSERINRAVANYQPTNNRSQLMQTERNTLIIDAYNANPSSMAASLANFAALNVSPKAVILGDMRELGEASDEEHAKVVELIGKGKFDKVLLCGEHFCKTGAPFRLFATTAALEEALKAEPLKGYHILVKGSRGMELEQVISLL
ncbi:MAG: UDP-N-acetylmuramoyl-tripeptide--D-alanyl-D-alanine ligase [Parabacteroides sp.]|nr:UDP-N-acetylmuramoyl-tripeptide--D-alanyl-D-alanine ligase [Parabacteroides sp.]